MTSVTAQPETQEGAADRVGRLAIERVAGRSRVVSNRAGDPLKVLTPRRTGPAAWAYVSTFGGGLVAGDVVNLEMSVGPGAVGVLTSQASTKVYHAMDGEGASQTLRAAVADDATLIVAPEPLVCFRDAIYEQQQTIEIAATGNLVLLDWFTCGRLAMDERWAFERYATRNRIIRDGRLVLNDALVLDRTDGAIDDAYRVGRYNCFATVAITGPKVKPGGEAWSEQIGREPIARGASVMTGASVFDWGTAVRLAGESTEAVERVLREGLDFLRPMLRAGLWDRRC